MYDDTTVFAAPTAAPPLVLLKAASLFLDFDGTLVDIAATPDDVVVGARLTRVLAHLSERLDGRLAIVSGRPVDDVRDILGIERLTVVGSHGLEYRFADGRAMAERRPRALGEVRERMDELALRWPGVLVEDKPLGAALHFRRRPAAEAVCVELAIDLAERHGLFLQTGKMMVEVRAGGRDKGSAIRRLMREPALRHTRPVFVGDDDTDEPGFRAVAYFGGAGVLVGAPRPSAARFNLPDTGAVIDWLDAACPA
jgi:trehalose 6-phosphate phosphatase